jgi:hypothetical protein
MDLETIKIKEPNILIVEGHDEERFFGMLIKELNLHSIQIINAEGVNKIRSVIDAISSSEHFNEVISLGIERDSNGNPDDAFKSICTALKDANLTAPKKPLECCGKNP